MAVRAYKKGVGARLSAHFKQGEFDCKGVGCCSRTLVDDELVSLLEKLRAKLGRPITISSGYRCERHNKQVGGNAASNHMKGRAADVIVKGVKAPDVAKAAESVGFKGIILYVKRNFVHLAVRDTKYFVKDTGWRKCQVSTFGGAVCCPYVAPAAPVRRGDRGEAVRWVQWMLCQMGYKLDIDGSFGIKTRAALRAFQANAALVTDGIAGPKTQAALKKAV